jgi:hypothetical protein
MSVQTVIEDPNLTKFLQMLEMIRYQHQWALADAQSVRADRDHLRGIVEALLGLIGKTAHADEIARWRKIAGLPETTSAR